MQALCRKQVKRPSKLYTSGSARTGYHMFVRALSSDSSEALWVQRFVTLAGTEPCELPIPVTTISAARTSSDPLGSWAAYVCKALVCKHLQFEPCTDADGVVCTKPVLPRLQYPGLVL